MKALIISNIFPPGFIGGYELGALDVAEGLRSNGHDVMVLTSDYFQDEENQFKNLNVTRTLQCAQPFLMHDLQNYKHLKSLYYNFANIRQIGYNLRKFKPDIVLLFNLCGIGPISIIQFLKVLEIPMILYHMDNFFTELKDSAYYEKHKAIFGEFMPKENFHNIVMSENVRNEINATLNSKLQNVTVIPGWVKNVESMPCDIKIRKNDKTNFVFCSRVTSHKGTEVMLEAIESLVKQGFTDFSVDVYGAGEVTSFLQNIKIKGIEKFVKYKGITTKDEMLKKFLNYDALLFPTWEREPFGFVASEAAVGGCLPILTAGTGASEWFLDGYDCLKISRNSGSLFNAMKLVLSWSNEELYKIKAITMECAKNNFSFVRWLPKIEEISNELIGSHIKKDYNYLVRKSEASFLVLNTLLQDSLAIRE